MSIRPVDLSGMLQRTHDVTTLKQNEDNKPIVQQHFLHAEQMKQEQKMAQQVTKAEEKDNDNYRYDAKEKGNNQYEGSQDKQKKKKENDGKVIIKGQRPGFDVKI